jgi:hypothetical protein
MTRKFQFCKNLFLKSPELFWSQGSGMGVSSAATPELAAGRNVGRARGLYGRGRLPPGGGGAKGPGRGLSGASAGTLRAKPPKGRPDLPGAGPNPPGASRSGFPVRLGSQASPSGSAARLPRPARQPGSPVSLAGPASPSGSATRLPRQSRRPGFPVSLAGPAARLPRPACNYGFPVRLATTASSFCARRAQRTQPNPIPRRSPGVPFWQAARRPGSGQGMARPERA